VGDASGDEDFFARFGLKGLAGFPIFLNSGDVHHKVPNKKLKWLFCYD